MLKQKLQTDQLTALKTGDKETLSVLRYILAQIKNKEIETRTEPTDDEVVAILRKQLKELNESIEAFQKGGRTDLVTEHQKQVEILKPYLPAEISDEVLKAEIDALIEANREQYEKNPKVIIGICMGKLKTKANPQRIMAILNSL